jgi:hypothetical protein
MAAIVLYDGYGAPSHNQNATAAQASVASNPKATADTVRYSGKAVDLKKDAKLWPNAPFTKKCGELALGADDKMPSFTSTKDGEWYIFPAEEFKGVPGAEGCVNVPNADKATVVVSDTWVEGAPLDHLKDLQQSELAAAATKPQN